ncbi:hypothetical protein HPB47_012579 [Ixodes persulcatus]|uniref:Uncharacterized protein n=1 Tax=Ixodes persulcatus TaxID=34615 RepID=A0AC60NT45_IXOPE|nr:hypothetical protein HPB47_012579 [Ixodes persulcatus]
MAMRARRRAASTARLTPRVTLRCKQRFQTLYILQQRQWEKKRKQEESRFKEEDFPPLPKGRSRSRSRASVRSTSRQRSGSRRRSKSRKRSSSRQRVSWAGVSDQKASEKKNKEAKTQNDTLDEILVMMRQLQEENKALRVMQTGEGFATREEEYGLKTGARDGHIGQGRRRRCNRKPTSRTIAVVVHDTGVSTVEHVLIEIILGKKKDQRGIFVLNIYSSPAKRHRFASLFEATLNIARRQTLVVVGDFNAQYPNWVYKIERQKDRKLRIDSHESGLSLITDPDYPTRRGDARQQDTTPDLTFVRHAKDAEWTNTWEDLGSDHYVLKTTIRAGPGKPRGRKIKIMEWNKFRELLGEYETEDVTNIGEWMECLLTTAERTTKVIPKKADVAAADSRLLHLWEAKASLQDRTIETYADQVTRQQWQDSCDGFDGQPNVPKTWNIQLHLLNPDGCKTAQRSKMCEMIQSHKGDEGDLLEEIRKRYIGDNPPRTPTTYGGADNEVLDADISEFEVAETLRDLKTNSAPGPDGVTNKMLRNLSNEAITGITKYINECWRQGQLPRQWKTAKVVMIPKPGKKPQLDALRPISLTSCVGKIMEHVILRRINDSMERNQLFPHTMVGFRPHLSTQDVMLRLKHQIIDGEKSSHLDTRVILGLDFTKAFDTIRHEAVLENLERLGVVRRTLNYVQDFLSNRTAQISIGGVTSDDINLGGRGTPQGSVLSPYLFNVAMIELPAKLSKIEGLHHSIYADDITLWMTGGRDGFIQDTLQEAIRTIEEYVTPRDLTCSPRKSELLLLKPVRSRQLPSDISLYSQGLRGWQQLEMNESLKASTYQITRLISRISGRHFGMKEKNLVRLVRAFVVSRTLKKGCRRYTPCHIYDTPKLQFDVQSGTKVPRTRELRLKRVALPPAGGLPGFEITQKRMRVLLCLQTCAFSHSSTSRHLTRNRARGTASEIALTDMAPIKKGSQALSPRRYHAPDSGLGATPQKSGKTHVCRPSRTRMRFCVISKPGDPPADGRAMRFSRSARVLETFVLDSKLDCLIRKAYKRAVGIPDSTSNEKLAALDLHNTVEEILEAQRTSPLERLTKSATGRQILEKLGIRYERQTGEKIDVPRRVREKLTIPNLPRHMHPVHHVERRTARAKALRRLLEKQEGVCYTDAARYDRDAMAAAMAIALALKLQDAKIIVSDSQMAIRQYAKGRISPVTLRVLGYPEKTAKLKLIWTPAHLSLPDNEEAHDAARATSDPSMEQTGYVPRHPRLLRRLKDALPSGASLAGQKTNGIYPSPAQLSRWYLDRYKGDCQLCGARATLRQIVWECTRLELKAQPLLKKIPNQESWEALLLCTDLNVQEQVVRLAEDAAGVQGILVVA